MADFKLITMLADEEKIRYLASFPELDPNPVVELDVSGRVTFCNSAASDVLGPDHREDDLKNFLPRDIKSLFRELSGTKTTQFYRQVHVKGKVFAENIYLNPQLKLLRIYAVDISEAKKAKILYAKLSKELIETNKRLQDLALMDPHTGLYNYRYLVNYIESGFAQAKRSFQPFSVIMMDIDYFKSINDVYGHQFGDLILKQFSLVLKSAVRQYDSLARYGGEEFVVISPATDSQGIRTIAERILSAVNATDFGDNKNIVRLKLSLAVISWPQDQDVLRGMDLINLCDKILSKAKEAGGNRIRSFGDLAKKSGEISGESAGEVQLLKKKLENLTQRMNQGLLEEISAFAKTVETKNHHAGGHVDKCIGYARELAGRLGFSEKSVEFIRQAAVLHDLGKIGINENILLKNNRLTADEFEEVKKHVQIGVDIISPIHALHEIIPFVLYHHERWDGTGYPVGLKGREIPLGARIISIVDTYDALSSDRPYRQAYPEEKARQIIKENAGKKFDPEIVEAFMGILGDKK